MNQYTRREYYLKEFIQKRKAASIIILLNTIMLIVTIATGGFGVYNLLDLGAMYSPYVSNGEWWRLFTVMFLHSGFFHFFANMLIGIYAIGSDVEEILGAKRFLLIYFVGGLVSSLTVFFFSSGVTVGASGAIFALLGSLLYMTVNNKSWFSYRYIQSIRGLVFVNIFITLMMPGISIAGHIGGLAGGYLISFLVVPKDPHEYEIITNDPNDFIM